MSQYAFPQTTPPVTYVTTPTTADSYAASAGFGIGSNDFIAACWYRPAEDIYPSSTVRPIFRARGTGLTDGWTFNWNFGVAQALVNSTTGPDLGGNFGGSVFWGGEPTYLQERDALIVFRVTGGGGAGTTRLRVYINMALVFDVTPGYTGVTPGTAPFTLGGVLSFGDAMSGGVAGGAYLNGTVTDAALTTWMKACLDAGGVLIGAIAWNGLWSTRGAAPGATWTDETGNGNHLTRAGSTGTATRVLRIA